MIAMLPNMRISTSCAIRFEIVTGRAVWRQKAAAVDQRPVRVRAAEIRRQDLVKAAHIAVLDRADVIAVEARQDLDIGYRCRGIGHGFFPFCAAGRDCVGAAHRTMTKSRRSSRDPGRLSPPAGLLPRPEESG